ncbi:MAG: peptidoglycan-binding protein [Gammaproteobacteria bacterium]|nr:peptidoglycan-binding protein [Gammaproteobacteria bacterium]
MRANSVILTAFLMLTGPALGQAAGVPQLDVKKAVSRPSGSAESSQSSFLGKYQYMVAQATGTRDSLQGALDKNPFLKQFGLRLTALDVADGFATIEITEGPDPILDHVRAGLDISDIDLQQLPSGRDRQSVTALRKVLAIVSDKENLDAIMMVAPDNAAVSDNTAVPKQSEETVADNKQLVKSIQRRLTELGYQPGPADGVAGRGTRAAIREYQGAAALGVNGEPSQGLLDHMNSADAMANPWEVTQTATAAGWTGAGKPVLGVAEFHNTAHGVYWWGHGVGWELASMVTNELANTKDFKIVERASLEPVLREQDLAQDGRIAEGTGAKIGSLTGANYLVMGTVSAFERNVQDTGGGVSFAGISLGGKKDQAYIAVDLRVVNTTTGDIEYVRTVEARSGGVGFRLGLFKSKFSGNLKSERKTPAGKAIRAVIVEIVDYLQCAMVERDSCLDEFEAKEQKRKESLKSTIKLD